MPRRHEPIPEDLARVVFVAAVDRFNTGRFEAAHEAFEPLWYGTDAGPARLGLQGLVLVSAALEQFEAGSAFSFQGMLLEGTAWLLGPEGGAAGLDRAACALEFSPWVAHAERVRAGAGLYEGRPPAFPRIVLPPSELR